MTDNDDGTITAVLDDRTSEAIREIADAPDHLARCAQCPAGVRFRRSASGAAFVWLERYGMDLDTAIGVSEADLPLCPFGHGEMQLEDERLPASEAFAKVEEILQATPPRLPFPAPPFNYEGVVHALFDKRLEIAGLEREYTRKKESAAAAKKALDSANGELGAMLDEYQQREIDRRDELERQANHAEAGHPEGTHLVRCIYEERNTGEACPLCDGSNTATLLDRLIGDVAVRDSERHLGQVVEFREELDIEATEQALADIAIVPRNVILAWTPDDRAAVRAFAGGVGDRPAVLGTAHIAGELMIEAAPGDTYQYCRVCGARLLRFPTADAAGYAPFDAGALVGTDCAGAIEGNHYPEKKGRKRR